MLRLAAPAPQPPACCLHRCLCAHQVADHASFALTSPPGRLFSLPAGRAAGGTTRYRQDAAGQGHGWGGGHPLLLWWEDALRIASVLFGAVFDLTSPVGNACSASRARGHTATRPWLGFPHCLPLDTRAFPGSLLQPTARSLWRCSRVVTFPLFACFSHIPYSLDITCSQRRGIRGDVPGRGCRPHPLPLPHRTQEGARHHLHW